MEPIVLEDGAAFETATLRLDHIDGKLGALRVRVVLGEGLPREHERVLDCLGHLADRQVDLQKTGRARTARSFLGGLDDARHDSQFVHETPIAKGVFPDAPSIRLLW